MATKKKEATATATSKQRGGPERAQLADHCNRVAHHLRRDLGERDGYPDGGPDRALAATAKRLDECATEFVRTGKPGTDEAVGRIVAELRDIDDDQASELADALEA